MPKSAPLLSAARPPPCWKPSPVDPVGTAWPVEVSMVQKFRSNSDRIHDPCPRIDRDICKDSPERADRSNQSGGWIDDHEIVGVGWRRVSGRTVKDASGRVVLEAAYAVKIASGIIQRTDRCKDGARGRVKGLKNTINTERSRRGIKHSSSFRSVALSASPRRAGEKQRDRDQTNPA